MAFEALSKVVQQILTFDIAEKSLKNRQRFSLVVVFFHGLFKIVQDVEDEIARVEFVYYLGHKNNRDLYNLKVFVVKILDDLFT